MKFPQPGTGGTQGFSLVEMLVAVLILGIVAIGLFQTMVTSRDAYEQQKVTLEMQQNARAALECLADDFRHVSYGKDPTQPSIEFADNDSITFVADIDLAVPGAEIISYSLGRDGDPDTPNPTDTILLKTVSDSSGTLLYAEPQAYGIRAGGLSIRYFNGAGVEFTSTPLASPELVGEALIEVTTVEPRQHKHVETYLEHTLSTTVYPRNLPLTPARSRPSIPTITALVSPNCESVTVSWQTPTTNTDGSPLALDDISHFTIWFGVDPADMGMYSRVARTINQWTVTGLTGGVVYWFGVTCTSRSGVESYMSKVSYDLSSVLVPQQVTGLLWFPNPTGAGARVEWNPVTQFTSGATITTPVDYNVYRSTTSGFTPGPSDLLETVAAQTWSIDSTMADCIDYYFVVSATACGNEGAPSAEIPISNPFRPACATSVAAVLTLNVGEIEVTWDLPTSRIDGSPLDPAEISQTRVFYGETPYAYTTWIDVTGADSSVVISGLMTCTTYYVNVCCFDDCPQPGDVCSGNEFAIDTSMPCDPALPASVPFVRVAGRDRRIDIAWPANSVDCDLYGYRLYYGHLPGGPYNGVGALEGDSPIEFPAAAVTGVDDTCRVSLTGLPTCQQYVVTLLAFDGCSPPNESPLSPDAGAQTECLACNIDAGCVACMTSGAAANDVRLEVHADAADETLADLIPYWTGPASILEVWAGRPLVKVWCQDGSAGGNGAIGPQPSGFELDVDDFTVPANATTADGLPLRLIFDADLNTEQVNFDFRGSGGGICSSDPHVVREGLVYQDFDDGDLSSWSFSGGTWTVNDGELYQSDVTTGVALYGGSYTDLVIEAKVKILAGATPYILFRGDVGSGTFYMLGLKQDSQLIRLCKYQSGVFTTTQQTNVTLDPDTWHMLRVEVRGSTARAWFDCQPVLTVTDAAMLPNGEIGFRVYASQVYYDDYRIYTWVPG